VNRGSDRAGPIHLMAMLKDESFMDHALELAEKTNSDEVRVGCVIVRDGQVISAAGNGLETAKHATIAALDYAADRGIPTANATVYVNIEPCAEHKQGTSCAQALIASRVGRVVIAAQDPHLEFGGLGTAVLRKAGMRVDVGVLQQRAQDLNEGFARVVRSHRPFVTLKAGLSTDGKLAPDPVSRVTGQLHWITGASAKAEVHLLRHASDAILTGVGTICADNPLLTDRSGLPRRRRLLRVILDTHLRMPLSAQIIQSTDDDLVICCGDSVPEEKVHTLNRVGAQVIRMFVSESGISLQGILAFLADRKIFKLLLECGTTLNGSFLREALVDKVILFYAPTALGPRAMPFASGMSSPKMLERQLRRVSRSALPHGNAEDIRVTGYLQDPWESPTA
jgi:diaminohydroxyphosphoribosylaminopyrimidine deaminase / 5-amino-6-(5-phosphoribosylamino)uracil reductase